MRNFKGLALTVVLALVVLGGVWAFWVKGVSRPALRVDESAMDSAERAMKPAPAFELKDSEGKTYALSEFAGKVVVLHFWASWCAPCVEELPEFLNAAKRAAGKPISWVAVSLDKNWEEAHKILPRKDLPENVISLLDPKLEVPEKFGSYQYPESYVLSPRLRIVEKWVGPQEWADPKMDEALGIAVNRFLKSKQP